MSELNFTITASNEEILRKLQEVRSAIEKSGDTAIQTSREIESQISRSTSAVSLLKDAFLSVGVGAGLGGFVRQVINVRSEFQNTEAAFRVFLGSMEAAKDLMKELQTYAFHNVFEFKDLTQQAASLLAFGTEVKDLTTVIDRLSNISAAVNEPLERFVDLYNKAKSTNKLDAVDIKQWSVMGDMIQYFSDSLGKSKTEIHNMVSAGSIGFKELEKVIADLTSEGGRFNGMMEEKMKTLGDSVGLLQDSITAMFNEIGERSEDFLRGGILATNTLVENYEKVGKALVAIIATYGTYRAAVVLNAVAESGWTAAQLAHLKVLMLVEKVQKLLNTTMLANPYVAIVTVLVGIVTAMWAFHDSTTAAEKAQKRLNDELEKSKQRKE